MYKSSVNQPERVFVNSSDDGNNTSSLAFNQMRINFQTPILGAKRCQLLRATIPNPFPVIPDYQCMFFYYNLNSTDGTTPSALTLRCIRLYPSNYVAPSSLTNYTKNRYISDPADLVTLLNAAASTGGDTTANNPRWLVNDVSFSYSSTTKKISIQGLSGAGYTYAIAGYNDTYVRALLAGGTIICPNASGSGSTAQPYVLGYTLNLRCGYAMSGQAINNQGYTTFNPLLANLTNQAFASATAIPSDSYPNLVYTQCFYLYADIVAGSSLGSGGQHNLLTVMPNNAAPLAVASYVAATINWLTKVPDNIYEVIITFFDDANQPLPLPDNAQVNVELGFWYGEDNKL
jgi:hypothetical protein